MVLDEGLMYVPKIWEFRLKFSFNEGMQIFFFQKQLLLAAMIFLGLERATLQQCFIYYLILHYILGLFAHPPHALIMFYYLFHPGLTVTFHFQWIAYSEKPMFLQTDMSTTTILSGWCVLLCLTIIDASILFCTFYLFSILNIHISSLLFLLDQFLQGFWLWAFYFFILLKRSDFYIVIIFSFF